MSIAARLAESRAFKNKQFHDNQIMTGKTIVSHFNNGTRYVQLAAQMQSGKTGCAFHVAFQMLLTNQIDQVYIISGGSETELKEQWESKQVSHIEEFSNTNSLSDDQEMILCEHIRVIWRPHLKKNIEKFAENYLIIWDESHFATTQNQTLHQFFDEIGLMSAIQGDTTSLIEKNSYVLSITATRDAEQARAAGANDGQQVLGWEMVVMKPGESYRGVVDFKHEGLITESFRINEENKDRFIDLIKKYKKQKKYMVLRCSAKYGAILEQIKVEQDIEIVNYNSDTKGIESQHVSISILNKAPSKFTLFVVKGMLRMGKELPKNHICSVFESAEKSNNNTILQGLLGRACGYHKQQIDIYLPKDFIAPGRGLDEYEAIVNSDFKIGLTGTQHTPRREALPKTSYGLCTNTPHHIQKTETDYTCSLTKKDGIDVVCDELLRCWEEGVIDKSRYTIEQQLEIVDMLSNPDKENFKFHNTHTLQSKMFKPTKDSLYDLENAIDRQGVILRGSWKPIIIWNINGSCSGTRFKKDECIVTFTTKAKSTNYKPILGPDVCPTNGTDIHHTTVDPTNTEKNIDVPGGQLHELKPETYHDVGLFKESLIEAIKASLNPERKMTVGTQITSNYWKGGKSYKGISFSGECYSHELLKIIIRTVEAECGVSIKITGARGRPTTDCENDIRISKFSWNK